jgi:hypothetical protein
MNNASQSIKAFSIQGQRPIQCNKKTNSIEENELKNSYQPARLPAFNKH